MRIHLNSPSPAQICLNKESQTFQPFQNSDYIYPSPEPAEVPRSTPDRIRGDAVKPWCMKLIQDASNTNTCSYEISAKSLWPTLRCKCSKLPLLWSYHEWCSSMNLCGPQKIEAFPKQTKKNCDPYQERPKIRIINKYLMIAIRM